MRTAALLALLAIAAPAAGGQTLAELAERHLAGDPAALDTIAGWSRDDVRRVRSASGRIEGRWPCAAVALLVEDVRRHRRRTPSDQRVRLAIARDLAASDPGRAGCGVDAAAPRLPLLVGLASLADGHLIEAIDLLAAAADRHPRDPELLTAHASAIEAIASLREFELPPARRRKPSLIHGRPTVVESADGVRRSVRLPTIRPAELEKLLRRATEADPAAAEARLRLGCTLVRHGHGLAAVPELERARGAAESPRQGYLARLCLGWARESSGDLLAAEHDYVAAAGLIPGGGQSAWLGAARSARRRGAGAAAQAHLERVLQADTADPWLDYPLGQPERVATLAAELVAGLRR